MNRAAIIIPTTGSKLVRGAIESCLAQTYDDLRIVVAVDGGQHRGDFESSIAGLSDPRLETVILPENTGAESYYGHRIYGGFSHLVNAHYLLFLDEDNFFDPGHVASMVGTIEKKDLDWAYALRKVCDSEGNFVAEDNTESLGAWVSLGGYHLIDTNCYCLKLQTAVGIAAAWFGKWGQDRRITDALMTNYPGFACTGVYSVNYRLRGEKGHEYFLKGDARMRQNFPLGFPWLET